MPLTIEQFTQQLSSSGLMTEDGLQTWLKSESFEQWPQDGEQIARELVKHKKLTKFQASQIYAGKGASLVLGNYVILDKLGQGDGAEGRAQAHEAAGGGEGDLGGGDEVEGCGPTLSSRSRSGGEVVASQHRQRS